MGRKPIAPSQRAQPISFSLKPHLIEKIDDYANDLRFSRSKFLQEAVTQYILKTEMGYMAASNNVNDMTLAQKVAVGLAALQEANREGETISKPVMDALRRELNLSEVEQVQEEKSDLEAAGLRNPVPKNARVTTDLYVGGDHFVKANDTIIGRIVKQGKTWRAVGINSPDFQIMSGSTLKEVTQIVKVSIKEGRVYF